MVSGQEAGTEHLSGAYVRGAGKAHLNIGGTDKRAEHTRLFGCPMVGTFNVKTDSEMVWSKPFLKHGADSYWLVRLRTGGRDVYAYAVRWAGSQMPQDRLELLSRHPISEHFKGGVLEITVYEQWSTGQVQAWQAGLSDRTKWQGHAFWKPQRADSALVWDHMKAGYDFSGKTVLDIGCNAGYFSFRAAQRGAAVTGVEKNKDILGVARTIQHHIEMTDINFRRGSYSDLLDRRYDYIFYLSVHHQHDDRYEHLRATLGALKERCSVLFVEIINPPIGGYLTKDAVDAVITESGGRELARYQHRVRRMRSLYVLPSSML